MGWCGAHPRQLANGETRTAMLHVGQKFQSEAVCFTKTLCACSGQQHLTNSQGKKSERRSTKLRAELSSDYRDVANRAMGLNHARKQTSIIKVGNQAMRLHHLTQLAKTSKTLSSKGSNQHRGAANNKKPELDN